MKKITVLLFGALLAASCSTEYDVIIAGGGAGGTAAGIEAARVFERGKSDGKVLIIEEHEWLGGMLTSAGVSAVDGNYKLPAGVWGEFMGRLADYYGGLDSLKTGWVSNVQFEPSVGNRIFHEMVAEHKNLELRKNTTVAGVGKIKNGWKVRLSDGKTLRTKRLIDATELGDVAVMAGVKYDVGMESRSVTGEEIAPEHANGIVQDLTYVAVLKDYGHDVSIAEPEGYDKMEFAASCANPLCVNPKDPERVWPVDMMISYGKLPNGKYMINWPIEGNDYYINLVEMTPEQREEALKKAKNCTMCFVYFIQHELGYTHLGLADDEYPTDDRLPFIPYHRESRRIHGLVRFNLNHVTAPFEQPEKLYRTGIAVGDYPIDHHHLRYTGSEELPNLYFRPVPSFNVPLGVLIPQDVEDLIVAEKSVSVSNIMNGTTRLQPVVLQLGQAAGALAAESVLAGCPIAGVSVRRVQDDVLEDGGYLMPYLDVEKDDARFAAYQRIGATGILRGVGMNAGWSNQTWLRASDPLLAEELDGFYELYPQALRLPAGPVCGEDLKALLESVVPGSTDDIEIPAGNLTRGDAAVVIDAALDPFHSIEVDIHGL